MTKIEALTDLLAKVEAEKVRVSSCFESVWTERTEHWDQDPAAHASAAYLGSLDAAMALHEAVLPFGFGFETFSLASEIVLKRDRPIDRFYGFADGNPARAWLIAILKALIAQEKNDD